ncbi:MAG TPA: hypothetical protein VF510_16210 [Ktedonobacterales bacterium]
MLVDWHDVEERLFQWCLDGIARFAESHPEVVCSFLAISYNTDAGVFQLSLDTPDNALREAQVNERDAIEQRRKVLASEWSWRSARYFLLNPRVVDYTLHAGAFAYHVEPALAVETLWQLQSREDYPQSREHEDEYAQGNVRVVIWRLVERLVEADAFAQLSLAAAFRVGCQTDDDELVVLRILTWPIPHA